LFQGGFMNLLVFGIRVFCCIFAIQTATTTAPLFIPDECLQEQKEPLQRTIPQRHLMRQTNGWSCADWQFLLYPSASVLNLIIDCQLFPTLHTDPQGNELQSMLKNFTWKQWKDWEKMVVSNNGDSTGIQFDNRGRMSEYCIYKSFKSTFAYDANGNLVLWTLFEWDMTGVWNKTKQYLMTYSTNNRLTQMQLNIWTASEESWLQYLLNTASYDQKGNLLETVLLFWDASSARWVNLLRYGYTVSNKGLPLESVRSVWNSATASWIVADTRQTFEYTANGRLETATNHAWNSSTSSWLPTDRTTYSYKGQSELSATLQQNWDGGAQRWLDIWKIVVTSPSAAQTDITETVLDGETSLWTNSWKKTYLSLPNGNLAQELLSLWDTKANDWGGSQKIDFSYTAAAIPAVAVEFQPDDHAVNWMLVSEYCVNFRNSDKIIPSSKPHANKNGLIQRMVNNGGVVQITAYSSQDSNIHASIFDLTGRQLVRLQPDRHGTITIFTWDYQHNKQYSAAAVWVILCSDGYYSEVRRFIPHR
ncbi:MAG: hypothetical protein JW795_10010, partial [Chitinivibrionales bacterium]|nr:hypothetical protein [Chitinivibrionales bacterium]